MASMFDIIGMEIGHLPILDQGALARGGLYYDLRNCLNAKRTLDLPKGEIFESMHWRQDLVPEEKIGEVSSMVKEIARKIATELGISMPEISIH